jgi:hypothetical protein
MYKRYAVVAVVAVVCGSACATHSKGSGAGEPETVTMESKNAGAKPDVVCSDQSIEVDAASGGKTFSPAAPWLVCEGQKLTVTNSLSSDACLTVLNDDGNNYVTPVTLTANGGQWDNSSIPKGSYTLGVCLKSGSDCTNNGCGHMTATDPGIKDTIKGNLSVVTSE